jgi:hypothetical protein
MGNPCVDVRIILKWKFDKGRNHWEDVGKHGRILNCILWKRIGRRGLDSSDSE